MSQELLWLKWLAIGALVAGLTVASWVQLVLTDSPINRGARGYVLCLDGKLASLFMPRRGRPLLLGQIGASILLAVFAILFGSVAPCLGVLAVLGAPTLALELMRRRRVARLEAQLDGFVLALSNALKVTPSIGAALAGTQALSDSPLREELGLALQEMRLGSTLDQALISMASRVGSVDLDAALSTVLIGRQVGGELPSILDRTARTLREMARLKGLLKAKTAESRMQITVLAIAPWLLIYLLNAASEGYFEPLGSSVLGGVAAGVALVLWVVAVALARRILRVDL